jgi:plasmid stabilization system protein ParE
VSWTLIIRPKAEADLIRAKSWYDEQRPGLGAHFLSEVESALEAIQENPFRQPLYHREFRRAITRRFPYKIFYVVRGDRVIVIRVIHAKQDYRTLI